MTRKWMFWLHNEDDTDSSSSALIDSGACREWTPFLTSLFDGEASEENALQARRHLIVCERCARAWFDWNQTRSLLQNHSAPPPPPSLLWRIRLACRLGQPQTSQLPELSAQILARTTRPPVHAALRAQWTQALRGLRFHTPLAGALALGAFVVLLSREGLLTNSASFSPSRVRSALRPARARLPLRNGLHQAASETTASALTPHIHRLSIVALPPLNPLTEQNEDRKKERSLLTLEQARHERETLNQQPVRLASYESVQPLPMLEAPRPRPFTSAFKKHQSHHLPSPTRLAAFSDAAPRPLLPAPQPFTPRDVTPPVMLARFSSGNESGAPSSSRSRAPRAIMVSTAPLRISAPHALPITISQQPAPDDSDWNDFDSTVQDYRASLADSADSTDPNSDAG